MSEDTPTLSIIVVTRNEAANIDDCLSSVLELCHDGPDHEVILVDSNSSDGSVERATEYPITVLQIPRDDLVSPAAGRFVGTAHASGNYLLFVDGDMQVTTGWLDDALTRVQRPGTAGVTGHLNDLDVDPERDDVRAVDALRGVALYDADALDTVGGFDPFLPSAEDADLGFRLKAADYRLEQLPCVVATHPDSGLTEPLRRWRRGYFQGVGQAVRKGADDPTVLARHFIKLRHPLFGFAWMASGVLLALRGERATVGWLVLTTLGVAAYTVRSGVKGTLVDTCSYGLTLLGVVLGGCRDLPSPDEYPLEAVEVITPRSAGA